MGMAPEVTSGLHRFTVSAADVGRRLDLFLAAQLPELSRARIQELIGSGAVQVAGRLPSPAHRVAAGERVEIKVSPRPPLEAAPEDIAVELLHEDDDFIVVNKPAGMVVHPAPGAPG